MWRVPGCTAGLEVVKCVLLSAQVQKGGLAKASELMQEGVQRPNPRGPNRDRKEFDSILNIVLQHVIVPTRVTGSILLSDVYFSHLVFLCFVVVVVCESKGTTCRSWLFLPPCGFGGPGGGLLSQVLL